MARAIVRYSCNSAPAGKVAAEQARAKMRSTLEAANFARVGVAGKGTACWERTNGASPVLANAVSQVLAVVVQLPNGVLDHLWVYMDE